MSAAKRGIDVILTYKRYPEQGQAVASEIRNNGGRAVAMHLDTSKTVSFNGFVDQVLQSLKSDWGRENFDYLVNNAGISQRSPRFKKYWKAFSFNNVEVKFVFHDVN